MVEIIRIIIFKRDPYSSYTLDNTLYCRVKEEVMAREKQDNKFGICYLLFSLAILL